MKKYIICSVVAALSFVLFALLGSDIARAQEACREQVTEHVAEKHVDAGGWVLYSSLTSEGYPPVTFTGDAWDGTDSDWYARAQFSGSGFAPSGTIYYNGGPVAYRYQLTGSRQVNGAQIPCPTTTTAPPTVPATTVPASPPPTTTSTTTTTTPATTVPVTAPPTTIQVSTVPATTIPVSTVPPTSAPDAPATPNTTPRDTVITTIIDTPTTTIALEVGKQLPATGVNKGGAIAVAIILIGVGTMVVIKTRRPSGGAGR